MSKSRKRRNSTQKAKMAKGIDCIQVLQEQGRRPSRGNFLSGAVKHATQITKTLKEKAKYVQK